MSTNTTLCFFLQLVVCVTSFCLWISWLNLRGRAYFCKCEHVDIEGQLERRHRIPHSYCTRPASLFFTGVFIKYAFSLTSSVLFLSLFRLFAPHSLIFPLCTASLVHFLPPSLFLPPLSCPFYLCGICLSLHHCLPVV